MKLTRTKYVIATKGFPLLFESRDCEGEDTEDFVDAMFYDTQKIAEDELTRFDEPELRQILPVEITYSF